MLDVMQFASTGFPQGGSGHMFIPSGMSHTSSFESHLSGSASTGSPIYLSNVHHQSPNVPAGSSQSICLYTAKFIQLISKTGSFCLYVNSNVSGAYMEQSSFQNKLPTRYSTLSLFGQM